MDYKNAGVDIGGWLQISRTYERACKENYDAKKYLAVVG